MIGVIGGILDFASATNLLIGGAAPENTMGTGAGVDLAWVVALFLLGFLVITSSILSVMSVGFRYPKLFAALMILYGAAMMISGWLMVSGGMQGTAELSLYGYGMLVIGALMMINGGAMIRGSMSLQAT